jgi:hypothetical protein
MVSEQLKLMLVPYRGFMNQATTALLPWHTMTMEMNWTKTETSRETWVQAAKKSLLDGNYMVDPIRLGLPKATQVTSLVMRFIDVLKRKKCKFDVTDANPNALLTYMDRDFIGLRNKGIDTAHTSNWNKTASNTRRRADATERREVPTVLSEISTPEQLLIDSKGL